MIALFVSRKDSVLKSLVKDLEESDEQFMMALRSHLQNVDGLVGEKFFSFLIFYLVHLFIHILKAFEIIFDIGLYCSWIATHSHYGYLQMSTL